MRLNHLAGALFFAACQAPQTPLATVSSVAPSTRGVKVADWPSVDSALRVAEATSQPLDMGGVPHTVALEIRANPKFAAGTNQARFVKIINCGAGLTSPDARPILKMAPGVSGYFVGLEGCLLLSNGIGHRLVDFSRMHNARFTDVWVFCGANDTAYVGRGAAYFNTWDGGLIGCGVGIGAFSTGGESMGPNSNWVTHVRFAGVGRGLVIGPFVQAWSIRDNAFETSAATALDLSGTRLMVGGNRFEGGPSGITLRAGSDGVIEYNYWSSISGLRIRFDGAKPINWRIDAQPR